MIDEAEVVGATFKPRVRECNLWYNDWPIISLAVLILFWISRAPPIMPIITTGNTQAPSVIIGERMAENLRAN